jgi:Family of unknown function (DUF5317)
VTLALAFTALLCTVPLAGGRLERVADIRVGAAWAALGAFAVQVLIVTVAPGGDPAVHACAHLATYGLAAYCVFRNRHLPYMKLIAAGGLLNLTAVLANGGVMPASASALEAAGLTAKTHEFANSNLVPDPHLPFLGDVFAIPAGLPGANVFSIGDALMITGAFFALHVLTASRLGRLLHAT